MKTKNITLFEEEIELINDFIKYKNNHLEEDEPKWDFHDVLGCAFQNGFKQMLKVNDINDKGFYSK
jgi:hypothetical protein